MKTQIDTGIIYPRDYGIVIDNNNGARQFFSPFKYVLAKTMLESKQNISQIFEDFSNSHSYSHKSTIKEIKDGIKRKEKNLKLFNNSRRDFLQQVKRYGNGYHASINSKSSNRSYNVYLNPSTLNLLEEINSNDRRCNCEDSHFGDVKKRTLNCTHLSLLEMALLLDNMTKESAEDNLTGLTLSKRSEIILPFEIGNKKEFESIIAEVIWQYYVENKGQFEINKFLLNKSQIYSNALINTLNNSYIDRARFAVLRESEQKLQIENLKKNEKEYHGAVKALEKRIMEKLHTKGFSFEGYSLEFKGTENETVSKRFRNNNEIYSICILENLPPIMIRKYLLSKSNPVQFNITNKPLEFKLEKYEDIDDATRRTSINQIFIPGEVANSDIFIPQILKEKYAKLRQK